MKHIYIFKRAEIEKQIKNKGLERSLAERTQHRDRGGGVCLLNLK